MAYQIESDTENPLQFPRKKDRARLDGYDHSDKIYYGDHWDAWSQKAEKQFTERYARLKYVVANFGGIMSRTMSDMLFAEGLNADYQDKNIQKFSDALFEENQLITQLAESAIVNSRRGDDVFKLRVGQRNPLAEDDPTTIIIEQIPATLYFPEMSDSAARNDAEKDVLCIVFNRGKDFYLRKETHIPGKITNQIFSYDPKAQKIVSEVDQATILAEFGFEPEQETGVDRSLIFHVPNVRDGAGFWGTSDYKDLDPLFFALNNRITKVDGILDKHSDPMLAVPPGFINPKTGKVRRESMGIYEVDSDNPGFNKPEYVIWDAHLEAAFKEIDKLVEFLFMFSEVSPATVGLDKAGIAESGRALKFKMMATLRKRNRKKRYYDQAIKDILETAQELAVFHKVKVGDIAITKTERPKLNWADGVMEDEVEATDIAAQRIGDGTQSRADAIVALDDVSPEDAKKKVAEIDAENGPAVSLTNNVTGAVDPNNPQDTSMKAIKSRMPIRDRPPVSSKI